MDTKKTIIEVSQVSKSYGSQPVLDNVYFCVRQGTIHGFIGPNGAGKTTTLSIMIGLVRDKVSGEVYYTYAKDGQEEKRSVRDNPDFNESLGFVSSEPHFPDLSVENYLLDCGYLRDVPEEEVLKKLTASPLAQFREKGCHSLSTGWKKILQLFILGLYQPEILILDEPFNGLDPSFRQNLIDELQNIVHQGKTVLMSTHILSDLQKLADDITMIKDGKIVYSGAKLADIEKTYEEYFIEKDKKTFQL
jgi:ABC-type multidrug transport system ATPase subunit